MARGGRAVLSDDAEAGPIDGSLRLCAVTRAELDPDDLIRFVAGPDGKIVPDLARRLAGRGVWVTADAVTIATAVRTKAFSRSLKRPVEAPADLPALVEKLLIKRAIEALSMANKAGLVSTGFSQVEGLLDGPKATALMHGSDGAPGGREKLDRKFTASQGAHGRSATIVDTLTIDEISLAMGRPNVVHAALIPGGATVKFLKEALRLKRYRLSSGTSLNATAVDPITEARTGNE